LPVFIWAPEEEGAWAPGGASQWWLHHALADLEQQLAQWGSRLILRQGPAGDVLAKLIEETNAAGVYWNRRYEPASMARDKAVKTCLRADGYAAESFNSSLLFEPWTVESGQAKPYKVYTPFRKCVDRRDTPQRVRVDLSALQNPTAWPPSESLDALALLPQIAWDNGFYEAWTPTREGAEARLDAFLDAPVRAYATDRDLPDEDGTSRLSPYLHWGQLGPREALAALGNPANSEGKQVYRQEILWREFGYHVLYHFPQTPTEPLQEKYTDFPWEPDEANLKAWQRGETGYPIVDAGMRQLWATGWMHNRVRMVVASFLVKHLLTSWREGARWFWDTLVDADLASNTLGWQWAGGCGADAAPYFRVFNPITQGEKFDTAGGYVRHWVPELKKMPDKFLHQPWEAPENIRDYANVRLGENYPAPIIEHKAGRERALAALKSLS